MYYFRGIHYGYVQWCVSGEVVVVRGGCVVLSHHPQHTQKILIPYNTMQMQISMDLSWRFSLKMCIYWFRGDMMGGT